MPWQCLGISFLYTAADFRLTALAINQEDMIQSLPYPYPTAPSGEHLTEPNHHIAINHIFLKKNNYYFCNYCRKICISHLFVVSLYYKIRTTSNNNIMETIIETIGRIIWAIVGGTISLAFIVGVTSALGYMFYYILLYGWKAFNQEFIPR